jgi:2-hydroxy-3-keto-5-methylthiopentenyl-1-phosphate phosphatase
VAPVHLFDLMTEHFLSPNRPSDFSMKTLIQCDFDGTVTLEDASFIMLDAFASGDWRKKYEEYKAGKISVGRFNREAFAMVSATKKALLSTIKGKIPIRPGFKELVVYCHRKGIRFVIVSNGLDFYIKHLMKEAGLPDIEFYASRTVFHGEELSVRYIGPDGVPLDDGFKEAYVEKFLRDNYRVVYIGDGSSDVLPARKCHYVFATGTLLERCRVQKINCVPFSRFEEITSMLQSIV